jgi:phosphatidylserine/phosphatidylglycerophosphate/cardiolipin synthase-like enzyme
MQERLNVIIGDSGVLSVFLADIESMPWAFKSVVLVSPFINFQQQNSNGISVLKTLVSVLRNGGSATLISDLTERRMRDLHSAVRYMPELENIVELCPKLHAKCGYTKAWHNGNTAFLGSANLTQAAIANNLEIVLLVTNASPRRLGWQLYCEIKEYVDSLWKKSVPCGHRN